MRLIRTSTTRARRHLLASAAWSGCFPACSTSVAATSKLAHFSYNPITFRSFSTIYHARFESVDIPDVDMTTYVLEVSDVALCNTMKYNSVHPNIHHTRCIQEDGTHNSAHSQQTISVQCLALLYATVIVVSSVYMQLLMVYS